MYYEKYGRYWAVYDELDILICITVYKKGAVEVIRRLQQKESKNDQVNENVPGGVSAWKA